MSSQVTHLSDTQRVARFEEQNTPKTELPFHPATKGKLELFTYGSSGGVGIKLDKKALKEAKEATDKLQHLGQRVRRLAEKHAATKYAFANDQQGRERRIELGNGDISIGLTTGTIKYTVPGTQITETLDQQMIDSLEGHDALLTMGEIHEVAEKVLKVCNKDPLDVYINRSISGSSPLQPLSLEHEKNTGHSSEDIFDSGLFTDVVSGKHGKIPEGKDKLAAAIETQDLFMSKFFNELIEKLEEKRRQRAPILEKELKENGVQKQEELLQKSEELQQLNDEIGFLENFIGRFYDAKEKTFKMDMDAIFLVLAGHGDLEKPLENAQQEYNAGNRTRDLTINVLKDRFLKHSSKKTRPLEAAIVRRGYENGGLAWHKASLYQQGANGSGQPSNHGACIEEFFVSQFKSILSGQSNPDDLSSLEGSFPQLRKKRASTDGNGRPTISSPLRTIFVNALKNAGTGLVDAYREHSNWTTALPDMQPAVQIKLIGQNREAIKTKFLQLKHAPTTTTTNPAPL